jgi:hypothetical protein
MESATSSAAETAPPLAADTVDLAGELIDARFRQLRLGGTSGAPLSPAAPRGAEGLGGKASERRCLGRLVGGGRFGRLRTKGGEQLERNRASCKGIAA